MSLCWNRSRLRSCIGNPAALHHTLVIQAGSERLAGPLHISKPTREVDMCSAWAPAAFATAPTKLRCSLHLLSAIIRWLQLINRSHPCSVPHDFSESRTNKILAALAVLAAASQATYGIRVQQ
mmetsp:Transcript_108971/g.177872  ORF Transcript_108971/g.177872 Transcript_108971/m.177872 type:complete len:123 (-) Transcript_108971:55-423(-)